MAPKRKRIKPTLVSASKAPEQKTDPEDVPIKSNKPVVVYDTKAPPQPNLTEEERIGIAKFIAFLHNAAAWSEAHPDVDYTRYSALADNNVLGPVSEAASDLLVKKEHWDPFIVEFETEKVVKMADA